MKVITLLASDYMYRRLKAENFYGMILSQPCERLVELRHALSNNAYDLAILDKSSEVFDDAVELVERFELEYLILDNDFEKLKSILQDRCKAPVEEPEVKNQKETPEEAAPAQVVYQQYYRDPKIFKKEELPENKQVAQLFSTVNNKLIVVAGLSSGAGSTFITHMLAKAFTDFGFKCSVIEMPTRPMIYDYLNFRKRVKPTDFKSIPHLMLNGEYSSEPFSLDGVDYLVPDPSLETISEWTLQDTLQLIFKSRSSQITIVDYVADYTSHESAELFKYADILLSPVDAMPHKLIEGHSNMELFDSIKSHGVNHHYVFNRHNKAIDYHEISKIFDMESDLRVNSYDYAKIYKAFAAGLSPYDQEDVKSSFDKFSIKVAKLIFPKNFLMSMAEETEVVEKTEEVDGLIRSLVSKIGFRRIR